jgi:TolB protein
VSPDGTQLLFMSNRDGPDDQFYIKNLGDDSPPIKISEMAGIQAVREKCWSPDGTAIIFTSNLNGKDQAYRMNVEPFKPRELLSDKNADLENPRESPDGSKMLFQARLDDHRIELRTMEISSGISKTIFKTEDPLSATFSLSADWSSNGSKIVFDDRVNDNIDIYEMNADGTDVERLTDDPTPDLSPVFSADDKSIFFSRDFYGTPRIFRLDISNRQVEQVMTKGGYEMSPAVTPDGRSLFFSADRQDGRLHGLDILAIDLYKPESERSVVSRPMHESDERISPDGKRNVFEARSDSNSEIYIANTDGSDVVRLTRNPKKDLSPTFSPDGREVIFCSDRDGRFAIYEIDLSF